ncbi:hypothetical protein PHMEG_0007727 [Phytophthora megakarya]|uniref:Uncharacterized protein n=1 Tax=Phytophthora megakarya TaxID=4795 RepID=A0A225WML9_9STRA|nr:hypothetical protein PHMEG_0007727 [Phytophthora megakarya]
MRSNSVTAPDASLLDDDEAAKSERDDVERRRCWLLKLPQLYTPKHRQRHVFLDLDNTAASFVMSRLLFRFIDGAHCPHDVRLNFDALTDRLCGASSSAVVMHQLATFSKTNPHIAQALEKFGWTVKTTDTEDNVLQTELLQQLHKGAATANGKTLVLALGGGNLGTANTSAYQEIISKFLAGGWHVEIHAWLRSLNDGYIRLQSEHPGRVVVMPLDDVIHDIVYLNKRKWSNGATTHVCPKLSKDEAPLKVATTPTSTDSGCNICQSDASPRAASVSPSPSRSHSVPPATSPNASWIKAALLGQRAASPVSTTSTTSSSFASHLEDCAGSAPFVPAFSRSESTPSTLPATATSTNATFTPPLPQLPPLPTPSAMASTFNSPTPRQPAYRWMLWELQLQQIRDLISAQQADLAMRQCALQQTTELMRLMQDQERKMWQASGAYQPPNSALGPWDAATWGF